MSNLLIAYFIFFFFAYRTWAGQKHRNQCCCSHIIIHNLFQGDGDSSVMKRLQILRPYGRGLDIMKIECRNHLLRNMDRKLRGMLTETAYPIAFRKKLDSNFPRFRMSVTRAAKYRLAQDATPANKTKLLKTDILNIPRHIFGHHDHCR